MDPKPYSKSILEGMWDVWPREDNAHRRPGSLSAGVWWVLVVKRERTWSCGLTSQTGPVGGHLGREIQLSLWLNPQSKRKAERQGDGELPGTGRVRAEDAAGGNKPSLGAGFPPALSF